MTIATPLRLRWERAQQIDPAGIQELGQGWYVVPSSRDPTGYAVHIEFDPDGKLTAASCTCPDFEKRTEGPAAPTVHGQRICKHVLAAALKAKGIRPQAPDHEPDSRVPSDAQGGEPNPVIAVPEPRPDQPIWDAECEEWVLTDEEDIHHCGAAPSDCVRQLEEAQHYRADHARKNGHCLTETAETQAQTTVAAEAPPCQPDNQAQPADAPLKEKRPQALSRARGIANQARPALSPSYRLYGISQGDVLDWSDHGMFLAVVSTAYDSLMAQGVLQNDPWGEVRDIRMSAEVLHLRLENGWLSKVRRPCR